MKGSIVRAFLGVYNRPILWLATLLHFCWGVALIISPGPVRLTTGLWPFAKFTGLAGIIFLASSTVAALSLIHEITGHSVNRLTFWGFMPQQALLMVSAGSVVYFVSQSHFADGTIVSGGKLFILIDQLPKILLALLHMFGVLRMHLPIFPRMTSDGRE